MQADSNVNAPEVKRAWALIDLRRAYALALAAGVGAAELREIFAPTPRPGEPYLAIAVRGWLEADAALRHKLNPHGSIATVSDDAVMTSAQALRESARGGAR